MREIMEQLSRVEDRRQEKNTVTKNGITVFDIQKSGNPLSPVWVSLLCVWRYKANICS